MADPALVTADFDAHQALYGYDDGHRLLASSVELDGGDQHLLARQTDSPDAGTLGWQGLLAGYPLPSGRYAWTMTWPAPEMSRPGCVWTHVLVLDPAAVAGASGFDPCAYFRHPRGPAELGAYRRPVTVGLGGGTPPAVKPKLRDLMAAVAWAFYEPPTRPVRIGRVALDEQPRHRIFLALWMQAWPELRGRLALTDAPYATRQLPTAAFDLQLQQTARRHADEPHRVLEGLPSRKPPSWAEELAADALTPGGLSQFLTAYGPDLSAHRDSVLPLTRTWMAFSDADGDGLLDQLEHDLGQDRQVRRLKRELLRPGVTPQGCPGPLPDGALLIALVARVAMPGVTAEELQLDARISSLLDTDLPEVSRLVAAIPARPGKPASEVLNALAANLDSKRLKGWLASDPQALLALLRLRPQLAADGTLWQALPPDQLWSVVKRVRGANQRVALLSGAVLSGAVLNAEESASDWPNTMAPLVQRLTDEGLDDDRLGPWLNVLSADDRQTLANRDGQPSNLVAQLVERMETDELKRWEPQRLRALLAQPLPARATARIFTASLSMPQRPTWAPTAVAAYEQLYCAAFAESLGDARPLLAHLAAEEEPEWDVGKRLARTLNRCLKQSRWPVLAALECHDRKAFLALIEADDKAGLARRVLTAVVEKRSKAAQQWQLDVLVETATLRADPSWTAKFLKTLFRLPKLFGL